MIKKTILYPAVIFLAVAASCAAPQKKGMDEAVQPFVYERQDRNAAVHVVLIGLDGWGAYYVPKSDMPTVKRMIACGSSSMRVQSVLPTNSWPNWSSMFMGAPPEVHGCVDTGGEPRFDSPVRDRYGFFPTIFALLKEQADDAPPEDRFPEAAPSKNMTALFYEWDKIGLLCPAGAADTTEHVAGLSADPDAVEKIARYITEQKPEFTVVVFNEPDSVGHSKRHGSPEYYAKLRELDGYIARLENAVRSGGFYGDTVFILTSDHGGWLWGHGFNLPRQRTIPLIVYGKNIRRGFTIPRQTGIYDIAPTIAAIFGRTPPSAWTGRAIGEIFIEEVSAK
ncbi:MAG: alkaline phosphatase [Treponema sp.]|jgi:predicted AlkP superfamily pyrophosphatase or phosphodiesterase|nr:alkaline phosphatase [Treponema sp.]